VRLLDIGADFPFPATKASARDCGNKSAAGITTLLVKIAFLLAMFDNISKFLVFLETADFHAMKKERQQSKYDLAVHEEQAAYGRRFQFLEFFAGGGMARAGLARNWESVWANDFCEDKALVYQCNWGVKEMRVGDVANVQLDSLPDADMAWGSFPCQDLSLAGDQSGIGSRLDDDKERTRSGTFWPFWRLVSQKHPPLVVLENVVGALTSNDGADLRAITGALCADGYRFGALVMDAQAWVPQSRPRLFIVCVKQTSTIMPNK